MMTGRVLAATLAITATWMYASDAAPARERYRWTGAAGDGRWSTLLNGEQWHGEAGWKPTEHVPTRDSEVVFGDAPSSAPQPVDLNYHTEVGRVLFKATGSNRRP